MPRLSATVFFLGGLGLLSLLLSVPVANADDGVGRVKARLSLIQAELSSLGVETHIQGHSGKENMLTFVDPLGCEHTGYILSMYPENIQMKDESGAWVQPGNAEWESMAREKAYGEFKASWSLFHWKKDENTYLSPKDAKLKLREKVKAAKAEGGDGFSDAEAAMYAVIQFNKLRKNLEVWSSDADGKEQPDIVSESIGEFVSTLEPLVGLCHQEDRSKRDDFLRKMRPPSQGKQRASLRDSESNPGGSKFAGASGMNAG